MTDNSEYQYISSVWQVLCAPEPNLGDSEGLLWRSMSAQDILDHFESGVFNENQLLRSGIKAQEKPLRRMVKELVWTARQEQEQRHSERDPYFEVVDRAPIPTALSDLGGRLTYVNQAFCTFLEYEAIELIGMTVGELSHPEDHQKEVNQGNQVMSGLLKGFQMEKRYITKFGSERIGILSIAMLSNTEGQPYAVLAQIADLTRIKEMQREITQSQTFAAIGRMAQQMTHDLKNILMVLKGTLDLLQDQSEHLSDDEIELINGGLVMCQSGEQLVRSLLDFNPNRKIILTPLHLPEFIREQSYTLRRLVSPIPFSISIESEGLVCAHRELFERALMNLCVNAKHAIEEAHDHVEHKIETREDEISITLRTPTPQESKVANWTTDVIYLEVNDTGVGIPDHLKEKILEPYVTTKGDRGGHGLGLFSVWTMCKQFNGVLQIESVLGQGSVFRFVLPLMPQEGP